MSTTPPKAVDEIASLRAALAARDRRIAELETVLRQARGVLSDMIKAEDERNEAASRCVDEGLIDRDCADDCPQDDTCDCPGTLLIGKAINRRNFHEGDCLRSIDAALAAPPTKDEEGR